jgi:hypothetical protein
LFAAAFNALLQQNRHEAEMPKYLGNVRCWVNSGKHLLAPSFSGFDPQATLMRRSKPIEERSTGSLVAAVMHNVYGRACISWHGAFQWHVFV